MSAFQLFTSGFSFWLLILAAIWLPVIYLLGAQWSVYEQYQYGWAVPFLCAYLAWCRFRNLPSVVRPPSSAFRPPTAPRSQLSTLNSQLSTLNSQSLPAWLWLVTGGLVYWLMRVLQEANPIWRLASFGLAGAAVMMALAAIYLTQGAARARHFAFPVIFFLVAVPWPTPVETLVIQNLTRLNAGVVVEILNLTGIPALLHGNVIEVSTGLVGIDEACSGIRSLQATLMIALFFGEFYRLSVLRRSVLCLSGPLLALGFNLARTLILVTVAARQGLPEMQRWHDPTGVALLVGCFICLWVVAAGMGKKKAETLKTENLKSDKQSLDVSASQRVSISKLALCLLIWAFAVEASTEIWFRSHERHGNREIFWTAHWPAANSSFHTNDIPSMALAELQCDQHTSANWTDADGFFWQAFWLRWLPADSFYGRTKVALSKSHNPAICLRAAGMTLETQLDAVCLPVRPGFSLVFDRFVFKANGQPLFVFFSQTEDMLVNGEANLRMTPSSRLRAVLAGSRNYGQNNFEVALTGPGSAAAALKIFRERLPDLIETQPANH